MITFETICKENYSRIFKYIYAMTGQRECAEDLTQEVFYIAYKRGKDFLKHEKPEAFLYKTAKNLVLVYFRKTQKEILKEPETEAADREGDLFEQLCARHEDSVEVEEYREQILQKMSPAKMELYRRYYVEHQPIREIAEEMHMSESAVRMRFVRLRREIRKKVHALRLGEF